MFRYHEMKNIANERQQEIRRQANNRGRDQKTTRELSTGSFKKPRKYSVAWIVNLLTLGFLS